MDHHNRKKERHCAACFEITYTPVTLFEMKYEQTVLSEIFEKCTSVKLQVGPTNHQVSICTKCLSELIAAFNFIKRCQLTNLRLQNCDLQSCTVVKLEENTNITANNDINGSELCEEKITVNECDLKEEKTAAPLDCIKHEDNLPTIDDCSLNREDSVNIQCEICSATMKSGSLKFHMMLHRGEKPNVCEYCGKAFTQRVSLNEHLKLHTGETPYICQYCSKAFRSKTSYKWHIEIHLSTEKPVPCGVCDKVLRSQQAWKKHQLCHNKRYLCNECGKCYSNKTQLTEHTNDHLGLKPHRCGTCGKSFNQKNKLTIHMLRHQEVKPYPCDLCNKGFVRKSKLSAHKKKKH